MNNVKKLANSHAGTCNFPPKWRVFYSAILIPHLKPAAFEYIAPQWELIFNYLRIASLVIILALYVSHLLKGHRPSGILIGILLYEFSLFISTWHNAGDYWTLFVSAGSIVAMTMLIDIMLAKNAISCIKTILPFLELLVYANLLTILYYPNGMYLTYNVMGWASARNWLLGYDNSHIAVILPAITLSLLHCYLQMRLITLRALLLIIAGYLTIFITWPATSIVVLMIMAFYMLFQKLFNATGIANCRNYVIVNIALFILIVVFGAQDIFRGFIEDILGKDLTFTTRTYVWDTSLWYISKNPLIGIGVESAAIVFNKLNAINSHNQYLTVLYEGGIIQFLWLAMIIGLIMNKLMKYKSEKCAQLLSVVFFCVLVFWQVESYHHVLIFFLLSFAYNIDKIIPGHVDYHQLVIAEDGI